MNDALGILFRVPERGKVKTRLAATLGDDEAVRIYREMLKAVSINASRIPGIDLHGFYDGNERLIDDSLTFLELHPQKDGTLGQRMHGALSELLFMGYCKASLIGSDSPDLPKEYIELGFSMLDEHDLVLGPALDGGYYLIGMRRPEQAIFDDMNWGGRDVLNETLERATEIGMRTYLLPSWYDIDSEAELGRWNCASQSPKQKDT